MILNLVTRSQVKTQLGINEITYDAKIDAMIPIVSSDVRRILNNQFNLYLTATFGDFANRLIVGYTPALMVGQIVYHPAIPEGTYVNQYDPLTGYFYLSANPTTTGNYVIPSITLAQVPAIAKMVWYKISQQNTESAGAEKLSSISYGPVSKTFAASEINSKWNYPQTLIDDLGEPFAAVG